MGELYSIGHSTHAFEYFLSLLEKYEINYVIDVRSIPYSQYAEMYNRENLKKSLNEKGINYSFMGNYFGARPKDKSLYNDESFLDFEKVKQSDNFNRGIESIIRGLNKNNNIALMCTEKDPIDCHRAILVSKGFCDKGINVKHILKDGSIQSQNDIEQRMLDMYFPDRNQANLFECSESTPDEAEYINQCYSLRNRYIGYNNSDGGKR